MGAPLVAKNGEGASLKRDLIVIRKGYRSILDTAYTSDQVNTLEHKLV